MNRQQKGNNDYWRHLVGGGSDPACVTRLGQVMFILMLLAVAYRFLAY